MLCKQNSIKLHTICKPVTLVTQDIIATFINTFYQELLKNNMHKNYIAISYNNKSSNNKVKVIIILLLSCSQRQAKADNGVRLQVRQGPSPLIGTHVIKQTLSIQFKF